MQTFEGLAPEAAVREIVPFRDQVIDRAARGHATDQRAGMAEWNATVHAAASLLLQLEHREVIMELLPIVHAFERCAVWRQFALVFQKSGRFAHVFPLLS